MILISPRLLSRKNQKKYLINLLQLIPNSLISWIIVAVVTLHA